MAQALAGKRILVVEDEYFIAADLKRALQQQGVEVLGPAGRLSEGLRIFDSQPLDAALIDVNLGGDLSFCLAERLMADKVPHMFLTGYDDWSIPQKFRATPRMTKPYSIPAVVDAVAGMLTPVAT